MYQVALQQVRLGGNEHGHPNSITIAELLGRVALGNIVDGSVLVALVYLSVYLWRAANDDGGAPRG